MIELVSGDTQCLVSPEDGGRIAALRVGGVSLLVERHGEPMRWGSFPMVPFAGRVRHGRFAFDGSEFQLPLGLPPHAIHGTVYTTPWTVDDVGEAHVEMHADLGPDWPFGGAAGQRIELGGDRVVCDLWVTAAVSSMPAQVGWHPWFVKPESVELAFGQQYERDAEGLPSGRLVAPTPGPRDDCFIDPIGSLRLTIGTVEVVVSSDCDHFVVFDEPSWSTCVEPQSGPPDGFNLDPVVLGPGETLRRTMEIAWSV